MPLSKSLVGTPFADTTFQWSETDAILYALGVGARPPAELGLLHEERGPAVLPTFALIANWWAVRNLRDALDVGTPPMVQASQSLELLRPLQPSGEARISAEISGVYDKGKHALVEVSARGTDDEGPLFAATSQTMILGAGGFGGDRGPAGLADPDQAVDVVYNDRVRAEQGAIYRLLGDRNPMHIDPEAAKHAGFEDVFLHGLCTFGFAARALINSVAGGRPDALRTISCRFAKPVVLDAGLRTEIWRTADAQAGETAVRFRTLQNSSVALSSGTAVLAEPQWSAQ